MNTIACSSCKHFNAERLDKEVCAAFPDGIPDAIKFGDNQHRAPFEGDHGIRWEPAEGFEFMDVPMPEGTSKPKKGVIT